MKMRALLVSFARTASERDKLRAASSQEFQPRLREQRLSLLSAWRFGGDFAPPSDDGLDVRKRFSPVDFRKPTMDFQAPTTELRAHFRRTPEAVHLPRKRPKPSTAQRDPQPPTRRPASAPSANANDDFNQVKTICRSHDRWSSFWLRFTGNRRVVQLEYCLH